jgi:hypothetical protein
MPDETGKPFQEMLKEAPQAPDTVSLTGTIERLADDPEKFNLRMLDGRYSLARILIIAGVALLAASVMLGRILRGLTLNVASALASPPPVVNLQVASKEVPSDFSSASAALSSYVAPAGLSVPSLSIGPGSGIPGMGIGLGLSAAPLSLAAPAPSAALGMIDLGVIPSALAATGIPPGIICAPHVKWQWIYETGTGIYNNITYLLNIRVAANGTGEAVAAIEVTTPLDVPPYYCQAFYWDDWRGNVVFDGSNMSFPAGWYNIVDKCNPARNRSFPISGVTFQWFLTANNKTLDIIAPFRLKQWNRFALTKTSY